MASSTEEILWRLSLDATSMREGTYRALDVQKKAASEYVAFWKTAVSTRESSEVKGAEATAAKLAAIDKAANEASLARLAKNEAEKSAVKNAALEKDAAMRAIASGSGGGGSGFHTAEQLAAAGVTGAAGGLGARHAASAAGIVVGKDGGLVATKGTATWEQFVAEGMEGGGAAAAKHEGGAAIDSVARRELLVMTRELFSGNYKRFFSSFSIFVQHLGPAALGLARIAGGLLNFASTSYDFIKLVRVSEAAKTAHQQDTFSHYNLASQTGAFGGRLQSNIDDLEKSGRITAAQAERLRSMTGEATSSDKLRVAQKFIAKEEAAAAQEKAKAEAAVADHVRAQAVAAEDKAYSEKKSLEAQKQAEEVASRLQDLWRERSKLQSDVFKIGQVTPSLEDLAGRDYTTDLNNLYGKGGQYDLGAGDGPFARIAQDAELAKKQQMWDIIHGNAVFGEQGQLIGGEAYRDKMRGNADENLLRGAGFDTPSMKMAELNDHLAQLNGQITELLGGKVMPVSITD